MDRLIAITKRLLLLHIYPAMIVISIARWSEPPMPECQNVISELTTNQLMTTNIVTRKEGISSPPLYLPTGIQKTHRRQPQVSSTNISIVNCGVHIIFCFPPPSPLDSFASKRGFHLNGKKQAAAALPLCANLYGQNGRDAERYLSLLD